LRRDVRTGLLIGTILAGTGIFVMIVSGDRWTESPRQTKTQTQLINTDSRLQTETQLAVSISHDSLKYKTIEDKSASGSDEINLSPPLKTIRFHIVRQGETLSSIAKQQYGSTTAVEKILEANKHVLSSADRIRPGMKLIMPD